jgi:hypothetical protein
MGNTSLKISDNGSFFVEIFCLTLTLSEILRKLYLILSIIRAGNYVTIFIPTTA